MYIEKDKTGKVVIHDLTPFEAYIISMVAQTHSNVQSLYSKDERSFLQLLSHSIDYEIFTRS